jgi:non-structural maintenance of chromosomes element 1
MAITSMQAFNLAKGDGRRDTQNGGTQTSVQSITMVQAQTVLKNLVDEGWFEKSEKGFYSLSPRALMELRGWLVSTYNEEDDEEEDRVDKIKFCHACKEIITMVSGATCRRGLY